MECGCANRVVSVDTRLFLVSIDVPSLWISLFANVDTVILFWSSECGCDHRVVSVDIRLLRLWFVSINVAFLLLWIQ